MAQLVVLGVDNRDDVERRFDLVGNLANQEQLQIQDAAYACRDDKGKVPRGRRRCLLARSAAVDTVIAADNRSTPRPSRPT